MNSAKAYKPISYVNFENSSYNDFNAWYTNDLVPSYNTPYRITTDWNQYIVNSNPSYTIKDNLNVLQGGGKYFFRGNDNRLWITYWNGTNFSSGVVDWNNNVTGNIKSSSSNEEPFYVSNNKILYFTNNISSTFIANWGGYVAPVVDAKKIVYVAEDGLSLYYINTNNNIIYCKRSSLSINNWLSIIVSNTNDIKDAEVDKLNPSNIYFINNTCQLGMYSRQANNFTKRILNISTSVLASSSLSVYNNKILFVDNSGNLWRYNYIASLNTVLGSKMIVYNGYSNQSVNNIKFDSKIAIAENDEQYYYITNLNVLNVIYNNSGWYNFPMNSSMNLFSNDIILLNNGSPNKKIFLSSTDGVIRHYDWGTCSHTYNVCDQQVLYKKSNAKHDTSQHLSADNKYIMNIIVSNKKIHIFNINIGVNSIYIYIYIYIFYYWAAYL